MVILFDLGMLCFLLMISRITGQLESLPVTSIPNDRLLEDIPKIANKDSYWLQ